MEDERAERSRSLILPETYPGEVREGVVERTMCREALGCYRPLMNVKTKIKAGSETSGDRPFNHPR